MLNKIVDTPDACVADVHDGATILIGGFGVGRTGRRCADGAGADVARSMGCGGMRVERPADLPDALEQAFAARKPYVVDAVSDASAFAERVRL